LIGMFFTLLTPVRCICQTPRSVTGLICWRVIPASGDDGSIKPSYIAGTIHSLTHPEYVFNPLIDEVMSSCEVFVLESNRSNAISSDASDYFLPENVKLKDLMSEKNWQKLVEACRKNNIDGSIESYMPWYLCALLTRPEISRKESLIMDHFLRDKALKRYMKVYNLETMATFALNKYPIEAQIEELVRTVSNSTEFETKENEITAFYNSGDVKKFAGALFKKDNDRKQKIMDARFDKILIEDRNELWLPAIEKYVNEGACFIAVGAAHLLGDNGIIESLKKKGYVVKDVSVSALKK